MKPLRRLASALLLLQYISAYDHSLVSQYVKNIDEFHIRTKRQTGGFIPECRDTFANCGANKSFCTLKAYADKFKKLCKVTCGVCDPEAEKAGDGALKALENTSESSDSTDSDQPTEEVENAADSPVSTDSDPTAATAVETGPGPENTCRDRLADCSIIKALCASGAGNSHYHCRKSCGLCDQVVERTTTISPIFTTPGTVLAGNPGSSVNDPTCVDKMGDKCKLWLPLCTQPDEAKRKVFVFQCKKTCGLCDFDQKDLNKPTPPPINFNKTTDDGQTITTTDCQDNYPGCKSTTKGWRGCIERQTNLP